MLHRLCEPRSLGLGLFRLGESAKRGEAQDQPVAVVDRSWCDAAEELVTSVGWQRRQIVGRDLNDPLVLATTGMHLLKTGRRSYAKVRISGRLRKRPSAGSEGKRLVELTDERVGGGGECIRPASSTGVVQSIRDRVGLAHAVQRQLSFAELDQR